MLFTALNGSFESLENISVNYPTYASAFLVIPKLEESLGTTDD